MKLRELTKEGGQALVVAVFAFTVLLGMAGIVTDVGLAFREKAHMQKAVDAASLAGSELLPQDPDGAEDAAREIAIANGLQEGTFTVTIVSTSYPSDTVRVTADGDSPAFFSRVLGFLGFDIVAKAAARSGSPSGQTDFIPLAVEQSVFQDLNTGDSATLKYDSQNQVNGNSLALALPGASGADDFREAIAEGSTATLCIFGQETAGCVSTVSTEPGQMTGPIRQGTTSRFNQTGLACDSFNEVVAADSTESSEYVLRTACHPYEPYNVAASARVVMVPVIDHLCNGRCDVHIVQFAVFFLDSVVCDNPNGNGNDNGNGNNANAGVCTVTGRYAERVTNVNQYIKLGTYNANAGLTVSALIE